MVRLRANLRRLLFCAPLALAACGTGDAPAPVDFRTLDPGTKPNWFLLAPASHGNRHASAPSPVLPVDAKRLFEVACQVIEAQPRTQTSWRDPDRHRAVFTQRSAVLGFTDDVDLAVEAVGDDSSTLALFSRSRVGYWDLGVNRRRVLDWLARIETALPRR